MKKIILNILIVTLLATGFVAIPKPAYAACSIGGVVTEGNGLTDCINELVVITVMPIVGKMLQITGYMFDKALLLNLNIAEFVQKGASSTISPVEVIWRMIRDLSGMFFIFLLLFTSIKMILGSDGSKNAIVGVIIAGLFVNFSLFATKVAIDASNAFSLTIYNAIAPTQATSLAQALWWGETVSSNDPNGQVPGGISSVIMEVVDLQTLYAATKTATQQTNFNVNSIVITVGGIALMLFLGIAFLAAAVMLLWRFIYLLGLMAFSPVWALAFAFPQLKTYSKNFTEELIGQCLFAPIFLFFVYVAMKVFTNPDFLKLTNPANSTFANVFAGSGIAPMVQYGLVLFIIYSGLAAASTYGGKGGKFGVEWMQGITKWGQGAIKNAGLNSASFVGRNTLGRLAAKAGEDFDKREAQLANSKFKILANTDLTRGIRKTLKAGEESKYGSRSNDDIEKAEKDRTKELRKVQLVESLKLAIANKDSDKVKEYLGKMTRDEKVKLKKGMLTDSVVTQHLAEGDYEAIDKSDKSDSDKVEIRDARKKNLNATVDTIAANTASQEDIDKAKKQLKTTIGKMTPKEVLGLGPEQLKKPAIIDALKASQLKGIVDDLDTEVKNAIRTHIEGNDQHQAHGYMSSKENQKWGGQQNKNQGQGRRGNQGPSTLDDQQWI